mgnify:FL=1
MGYELDSELEFAKYDAILADMGKDVEILKRKVIQIEQKNKQIIPLPNSMKTDTRTSEDDYYV